MHVNNRNLCENCFEELSQDVASCSFCGYAPGTREADSNLPAGTVLMGKYIIGKVLGKGGFGVTYLAWDLKAEQKTAIKEYMPDTLSYRIPGSTVVSTYSGEKEQSFRLGSEKFYEEAKTISRFSGHPNIIHVYEFFYENNTAYFVMEYIDGVDLKAYVQQKDGRLSEEEAIRIAMPVMEALSVVHSIGILHRDISPDNIYVTKAGEVRLLDFGAARQVLGDVSKSLSVVLKPGFAPIEQYQSHGKQGPWTDVYALAATVYYCITGNVPVSAMDRIETDTLKTPAQFGAVVSQAVWNILQKALALRATERYLTMAEFNQALKSPDTPANGAMPEILERVPEPMRKERRNWIPYLLVCMLLVISIVAGITLWRGGAKNDEMVNATSVDAKASTVIKSAETSTSISTIPSVETQTAVPSTHDTNPGITDDGQITTVKEVDYLYTNSFFSVICKYSGEWKNQKPNGRGTLVLEEDFSKYYWGKGSKFTGTFTDGVLNGQGTCIYADGCLYDGNYENGLMEGEGICTFTNGDVYEGQWKNDKMEGQGTYTSKNGEKYEGQWVKSKKEGQGTKIYKDGSKYVGEWKNGKRNGNGILYGSNGDVLKKGSWANDKYTGE